MGLQWANIVFMGQMRVYNLQAYYGPTIDSIWKIERDGRVVQPAYGENKLARARLGEYALLRVHQSRLA